MGFHETKDVSALPGMQTASYNVARKTHSTAIHLLVKRNGSAEKWGALISALVWRDAEK